MTILEGESLLNDATALVALRTAIAAGAAGAAMTTSTTLDVAWDFVLAAGGGVLVGLAAFFLVAWLRKHVTDPLMDTAISLVVPFVGVRRGREDPRLRRDRGRDRGPAARAQGADRCRPRSPGSPSG